MSHRKPARKDVLPLPTAAEIQAHAPALRDALNLDDDASTDLIRGGLAYYRDEALESFTTNYLVNYGSMLNFTLNLI